MKKFYIILSFVLFCQLVLLNYTGAQDRKIPSEGISVQTNAKSVRHGANNLTSTKKHNSLDKYFPSDSAIELIEKRTRDSKQYVDKDTISKIYMVKSIGALHYWKDLQWLTIDESLENRGDGIIEASHQEEPVGFDTKKQLSYIKSLQGIIYFNNWVLYGIVNGEVIQLDKPNWSNYVVGDKLLYVTNIFAGIDAEMKVGRGTVKTSFIIHKNNYPQVQQLVFKDIFQSEENARFEISNGINTQLNEAYYTINNTNALHLSQAVAYQENDAKNSSINLFYELTQDTLSLSIDASYINAQLLVGNVVVDPLVSTANSIAQNDITGSMDCGTSLNSCNFSMTVPSPPKTTITDVYFMFGFQTVGSVLNRNGFWTIKSGSCKVNIRADPDNVDAYNSPGTTSTFGEFDNLSYYLLSCMPAPSCISQNIPFTLGFYNNICTGSTVCSENNIKANEPFVIMIEGRTVELDTISSNVTICAGENTTLCTEGIYGVPPYTYTWNNGGGSGKNVVVSPAVTTTYTVTITDQCNNTATGSVTVSVKPVSTPSTITVSICEGESYSLNGVAYSTAGVYTAHLLNVVGCDSTVILHLSVFQPNPPTIISEEICSGEIYHFGNSVLTESGVYTNQFSTSHVCDSFVTLTLHVKPTYSMNQTVNVLYGEADTIDGHIYDRPGKFTDIYVAQNGCDSSIVTTVNVLRSLCPKIGVPQYFTPNGDGKNDFFEIENIACYLKSTVKIYDRFGKLLVSYSGLDLGWDGQYLGSPVPSTDYWYEIVLPETGERLVGHFILKR